MLSRLLMNRGLSLLLYCHIARKVKAQFHVLSWLWHSFWLHICHYRMLPRLDPVQVALSTPVHPLEVFSLSLICLGIDLKGLKDHRTWGQEERQIRSILLCNGVRYFGIVFIYNYHRYFLALKIFNHKARKLQSFKVKFDRQQAA